jgi:hypothetical protein
MSTEKSTPVGHSVLRALRSDNISDRSRAFDLILVTFWKAVYKHVRRQWTRPSEEAKTLTLAFFSRVMQAGFFDRYDPKSKRLRTFLREEVDTFVSATGGAVPGTESLDLNFREAEEDLTLHPANEQIPAEELFDSEWVRNVFTLAIEQLHNSLESQGKSIHFKLFQRYDLQDRSGGEEVSLEQVAQEFSLPLSDVAMYLNDSRQLLRANILNLLRSFTSSDDELRREARSLFGL